MFGAIADMLMTGVNNMYAQERQDDQQQFNSDERIYTQAFNSAEAAKQRQWQHDMSASAYQRTVHDLKLAGLNPMLAYGQGASHAGAGAAASSAIASSGTASPGGGPSVAAGLQSASQIELNDALAKRTEAEAEKVKAETEEVRQKTPTHAVNIQHTLQQIDESRERIHKIIQDTKTSASSAHHYDQQVINLKETIPQIRAAVEQLKSLTQLNAGQLYNQLQQGHLAKEHQQLTRKQVEHLQQTIAENMPMLEATLKRLEQQSRLYGMPRQANDALSHDSALGKIGSILRSLLPIGKQ